MNVAKIVATLWPRLRGILMRIGRWIIEFLWKRGRTKLIGYMEGRIDVFERRLRRICKRRNPPKWRIRWLRGRISRWKAAIRWLEGREAAKIKGRVGTELLRIAEERIPEEAPHESYARWRRRQAA